MSEDVYKHKRPATIFCDIDGVLLTYQGSPTDRMHLEPAILPGVLAKFSEWDYKGFRIFLTTGRKESMKEETIRDLKKFGLFWDKIIFDCGGGPRVLINDLKPGYPDSPTAIAFNLPRNEGLTNVNV